jgi:hypothetical protein
VTLSGWVRAKPWSQLGIVATGTIALLANMRTKKGRIPAIWAVSGSFVARPIAAYIHENV